MNLHEIMLAKQLAGKNGGGNVDLSNYYTKAQTDQRITEKVAEIVSDAPEDFDTLKELSDWIENHEDSAAAMNSAIVDNTTAIAQKADKSTTYTKTETDNLLADKVSKESGKVLSSNDFTDAYKSKLDSLENYDDTEVKEKIDDITDQIFGLGEIISANSNLNTYTKPGIYYSNIAYISASLENTPYKTGGFRLEVSRISTVNGFMQTLYPNSRTLGVFFIRAFTDGAFGSWFKFSGEVVATT